MKHLNRIINLRNPLKPLLVLCGVMVRYCYYRITDKPRFKMKYKDGVIGQFEQPYKFQRWMLKSGHGVKIVVD